MDTVYTVKLGDKNQFGTRDLLSSTITVGAVSNLGHSNRNGELETGVLTMILSEMWCLKSA